MSRYGSTLNVSSHLDPTSRTLAPSPQSIDPAVGERIAEARAARGLNRNRLARMLGTSWAVVNRWEKGRAQPSSESMRRLASALGVTIDWLVGREARPVVPLNEGLAEFLRDFAPSDITEAEVQWLREAPVLPSDASARRYYDIFQSLRTMARRDDSGAHPQS